MTPNEKAASFIGWSKQRCRENPTTAPLDRRTCHRCSHGMLTRHVIKAPDMSKPENYMRALEAVRAARIYYPEILTNRIGWLARFRKDLELDFSTPMIAESHSHLGDALIAALAALYDAEHSE